MNCKCNKKILIPVIAVIAAAIILGVYYIFLIPKDRTPINVPISTYSPDSSVSPTVFYAKNVTIVLNTGSGDVSISTGTNAAYVIDLLAQLQTEGKLSYTTEDSVYGAYLSAVNGRAALTESNEYYALYINNDYASFGITQQIIASGDTIKIVLETW